MQNIILQVLRLVFCQENVILSREQARVIVSLDDFGRVPRLNYLSGDIVSSMIVNVALSKSMI